MISFDQFNENARLAVFFSRVAVSEHGGRSICDTHLLVDDPVLEILDAAVKAAEEAGQHVGPQHLLLATLRVGGEAASCLMQAGIDLDAAQRLVRTSASGARGPRG